MTLPRSFTRAALFDHITGRLGFTQTKQVEKALGLLRPEERAVLFQAHAGGDRSSVDWKLEETAVDALGTALAFVGYKRHAPAKPPAPAEKSAA